MEMKEQQEAQEETKIEIITYGKPEQVQVLIKQGMRPDERFKYFDNCTPLHCANSNENTQVLKCLLDESMRLKINIDIKDNSKDTYTPLLEAARAAKLEHVKLLLEYGADPDITDSNDKDLIACMKSEGRRELIPDVKAMIKKYSSPKQKLLEGFIGDSNPKDNPSSNLRRVGFFQNIDEALHVSKNNFSPKIETKKTL